MSNSSVSSNTKEVKKSISLSNYLRFSGKKNKNYSLPTSQDDSSYHLALERPVSLLLLQHPTHSDASSIHSQSSDSSSNSMSARITRKVLFKKSQKDSPLSMNNFSPAARHAGNHQAKGVKTSSMACPDFRTQFQPCDSSKEEEAGLAMTPAAIDEVHKDDDAGSFVLVAPPQHQNDEDLNENIRDMATLETEIEKEHQNKSGIFNKTDCETRGSNQELFPLENSKLKPSQPIVSTTLADMTSTLKAIKIPATGPSLLNLKQKSALFSSAVDLTEPPSQSPSIYYYYYHSHDNSSNNATPTATSFLTTNTKPTSLEPSDLVLERESTSSNNNSKSGVYLHNNSTNWTLPGLDSDEIAQVSNGPAGMRRPTGPLTAAIRPVCNSEPDEDDKNNSGDRCAYNAFVYVQESNPGVGANMYEGNENKSTGGSNLDASRHSFYDSSIDTVDESSDSQTIHEQNCVSSFDLTLSKKMICGVNSTSSISDDDSATLILQESKEINKVKASTQMSAFDSNNSVWNEQEASGLSLQHEKLGIDSFSSSSSHPTLPMTPNSSSSSNFGCSLNSGFVESFSYSSSRQGSFKASKSFHSLNSSPSYRHSPTRNSSFPQPVTPKLFSITTKQLRSRPLPPTPNSDGFPSSQQHTPSPPTSNSPYFQHNGYKSREMSRRATVSSHPLCFSNSTRNSPYCNSSQPHLVQNSQLSSVDSPRPSVSEKRSSTFPLTANPTQGTTRRDAIFVPLLSPTESLFQTPSNYSQAKLDLSFSSFRHHNEHSGTFDTSHKQVHSTQHHHQHHSVQYDHLPLPPTPPPAPAPNKPQFSLSLNADSADDLWDPETQFEQEEYADELFGKHTGFIVHV